MEIKYLLFLQIIADVILCGAILFMLLRLKHNMGKTANPMINEEHLLELSKLIKESREEAGHFADAMEDGCRTFKGLAGKLEEKEAILLGLIYKIEKSLENIKIPEDHSLLPRENPLEVQHEHISKAYKEGATIKEIAERLALPEGEVSLIIGLKNAEH